MSSDEVINYDEMLFLDAEDLAETGMNTAYEQVGSVFRKRGIELSPIYGMKGHAKAKRRHLDSTDAVVSVSMGLVALFCEG